MLLRNHFTAAAALIALQMHHLPDEVRTRVMDAVRNGTGKVELRTAWSQTRRRLYQLPTDRTEAFWRARTPP